MTWRDLLFAHWPVPSEALRPHVPTGLEIDVFDGTAWLGVVAFLMDEVRIRGVPALPGASSFPELNVRTYVRAGGRSGVWFFSLDAASRLAVRGARLWFGLPYFKARMNVHRIGARDTDQGFRVRYESARTDRNAPPARFEATYGPTGPGSQRASGTLAHWLTERYCLFAVRRENELRVGDVHHEPWTLHPAEMEIRANSMGEPLRVATEGEPLLHFAHRVDVVAWSPTPLADSQQRS